MKQEPFHCEWFFSFRSDEWLNAGKEYSGLYEIKTTCQAGGKVQKLFDQCQSIHACSAKHT